MKRGGSHASRLSAVGPNFFQISLIPRDFGRIDLPGLVSPPTRPNAVAITLLGREAEDRQDGRSSTAILSR